MVENYWNSSSVFYQYVNTEYVGATSSSNTNNTNDNNNNTDNDNDEAYGENDYVANINNIDDGCKDADNC